MQIYSIKKEHHFSYLNNNGYKFFNPYCILIFQKDFTLLPINNVDPVECLTIVESDDFQTKAMRTGIVNTSGNDHFKCIKLLNYKRNRQKDACIVSAEGNDITRKSKINPAASSIYLGFKVSRKLGGSIVRNKIKRRIRHLIRLCSHKLIPNNYGIIIIPRSSFSTIKFSVLVEEIYKNLTPYFVKQA